MSQKRGASIKVGVDVGGTNTEVGFVDTGGRIVLHTSFPTNGHEAAAQFVDQLCHVIDEQLEGTGYGCWGIGIAAPNVNHLKGTIDSPANLTWGTVDLVKMLRAHYDCAIRVIKDANAAALGEMGFGAARGMRNFAVITLGTGLGSGFVIDGKILEGANGLAGELGHTSAMLNGRECGCGRFGCLETYVSAPGIRRTALELLSCRSYDTDLSDVSFNNLTAEMIHEAARRGDLLALDVLDFTGKLFGRTLADVVASLDPEAFIIMGGVANAGDLLLEPTRRYCRENLLHIHKGVVRILQSEMENGHAAILGATMLVERETSENGLD